MILKIVEGVSSKDTFHVVKTAVDLSIFSQLPFFKNYFLKLLQKLKKPHKDGLTELVGYVQAHPHLNPQPLSPSPLSVATWAHHPSLS